MLSQNADSHIALREAVARERRGAHVHHAYLLEGDCEAMRELCGSWWDDLLGVRHAESPDFRLVSFETMQVDNARDVARLGAARAFGARRVIALDMGTPTINAQSALLKLLEEPLSGTHFFVSVARASLLLPTIKSRCRYIGSLRRALVAENGARFLAASYTERLAATDGITLVEALELLDDAEAAVAHRVRKDASARLIARALIESRRQLIVAHLPPKLVLGHLAVTLPVI